MRRANIKDDEAIGRFGGFLAKKNHRLTSQRRDVLNEVMKIDGHFDAEDVVDIVRNERLRVSRATVYRTLEFIEACNLIQNIGIKNGRRLFEKVADKKQHEHMQCVKCGKTIEFRDTAIENRVEAISRMNGFACANYAFQIFGICDDCRERVEMSNACTAADNQSIPAA